MNELDFTLELNSESLSPAVEADLFEEADTRLRQLAEGHSDIIGAAVNMRLPAQGETPPLHEATVVVYSRPEHIAATKKEEEPAQALLRALEAVERQIRQRRNKLRERWEQPGNQPVEQEIEEIIAAESMPKDSAEDSVESTPESEKSDDRQ